MDITSSPFGVYIRTPIPPIPTSIISKNVFAQFSKKKSISTFGMDLGLKNELQIRIPHGPFSLKMYLRSFRKKSPFQLLEWTFEIIF